MANGQISAVNIDPAATQSETQAASDVAEQLDHLLAPAHPGTRHSPRHAFVIFGASGDLASRKIFPALASLARSGELPDEFTVVGVARTELDDASFRRLVLDATGDEDDAWRRLVPRFRYVSGDYGDDSTFRKLCGVLSEVDRDCSTGGSRVYYLATVPSLFGPIATSLGRHGIARAPAAKTRASDEPFVRIVVEKPYGRDLAGAIALDELMHSAFDESQIYRIDHYMGKETVQNVIALRFANAVFEPIWNRRYVDHVQVTVAESLGVEHRGGFYETAGALRDIVQNHVMQVVALTLMEPPAASDAQSIRDEKVKLLRAIEPPDPAEVVGNSIRAQYGPGTINSEAVPGYRFEPGVASDSTTETYVALQLSADNWRWAGVPIYVRTGKRLPKRLTEVALQFRGVPHLPFQGRLSRDLGPNVLVIRIQPDEGIALSFGAKVPGAEFRLRSVSMDFSYEAAFSERPHDAYERLLLDAMMGDATLFIRSDEVDHAWRIVDPILSAFSDGSTSLHQYAAGTWGPHEANLLLERQGRRWRIP